MYKVHQVPQHRVQQTWDAVEDYIASALKYSGGEYTIEQARLLTGLGAWKLFIAVDDENVVHGACTVQFNPMPNDMVAFVTAIGGKYISDKDIWGRLVKLFKDNGATEVQGAVREASARWLKHLGFTEKYKIVGVKI